MKYKEGKSLADHLNEIQGIVDQLSGMGIKMEDEVVALLVLASLPESWETLKISLTNSAKDGVINMEIVKSGVLNEEMRKRSQGASSSSSQSDLLTVDSKSRGRSEARGSKQRGKSRGKSNKFANIQCHHYKEKGHIRRFCPKFRNERKKGKRDENSDDDGANSVDEFNIVYEEDIVNLTTQETSWVVDSGATIHVTSKREFFSSYTPGDFGVVRMRNGNLSKVIGKGEVFLETMNGTKLLLKDVRHVPEMCLNLISVDKLDEEGYCNTFHNGQWKLTRGSLVLAKGKKLSKLYVTEAKISPEIVNSAENGDTIELWHKRLGHMSEKSMAKLAKKKVIIGLDHVHLKKCFDCLVGKQNRVAFKSSIPSRAKNVLDLVHSDVCEPDVNVKSLGGARYFVTFIDDHSRKTWVYTLKTKDQALDVFKQFLALVERETGKKLKCIRTDNGGEYRGPFATFCKEHGIRQQFTPPKTTQLNGLAERMNMTLLERVRCLLSHSKLPQSFWGEALLAAVYVWNRSPSVPLKYDAPEKVWTGKEVSYKHLRVFGCKAFVHIPKDERSKLDSKTRPCVFIGYGQNEFGYRFFDPIQKKLIRSRDAVFIENETIEDVARKEVPSTDASQPSLGLVPPTSALTEVGEEAQHDQPEIVEQDAPVEVQPEDADDDGQPPAIEGSPVQMTRFGRVTRRSTRYPETEYVSLTDGGEPESFTEAMNDEHKQRWIEAMQDEMDSLYENKTFELMTSICTVLGLAASLNLEVEQMDVKTAFLHGDLEEEIYMEQPEGFKKEKRRTMCAGSKFPDGDFILILLYVDDMLIAGQNVPKISDLKELSKSFSMKDLGSAKQILGVRIVRDLGAKKIWLSQEKYIENVLQRFNMDNAKAVSCPLANHFTLTSKQSPSTKKEKAEMDKIPYASAVGSLMYAMVCTRPDIAHAVGVVSRFLSKLGKEHWEAVKWILRYLRGSSKMILCFGDGEPVLVGYTDADMAGDVDSRRSTSGYLITLSGGAISWQSRLQKCVALSTTEAEYIATTKACKEMIWMKKFLKELGFQQEQPQLFCDSQSAIHLAKNASFHARSKHIDVRYHWIRDVLEMKQLQLKKIHTDKNGSDMCTKTLPREKFEFCRSAAGMAKSHM
ncbi:unnamed protein product [Linum trigynum]|uniref:Integrase catalytic domain-containing protein n=1 Tax=Linum trigynum TaxID=586398 RepID=A0AAV2E3H6_9ROSI